MFQDWLRVFVPVGKEPSKENKRFQDVKRLAASSTDFLWQRALMRLVPRAKGPQKGRPCHLMVLGDAVTPEEVSRILEIGPKYSLEPCTQRQELLAILKRVASHAADQGKGRIIGDGVGYLNETVCGSRPINSSLQKSSKVLKDNDLLALQADKECGLAAMPADLLREKALTAIDKNFKTVPFKVRKQKRQALKIPEELHLESIREDPEA